jgi:hypothetical protein
MGRENSSNVQKTRIYVYLLKPNPRIRLRSRESISPRLKKGFKKMPIADKPLDHITEQDLLNLIQNGIIQEDKNLEYKQELKL